MKLSVAFRISDFLEADINVLNSSMKTAGSELKLV
jgi:hypothetical protein